MRSRPWEADRAIEPTTALELIQTQFPELSAQTVRLLGTGWDNTAFIVDEKWIFRFPRREVALPLLEVEWSLLPKLAPKLPLPIPTPRWRGSPTPSFPWPFIGYPAIPGVTACSANLSEEERAALAEPLAHFLRALHQIPTPPLGGVHSDRIDSAVLIKTIEKNFNELSELNLLPERKALEQVIANLPLRPPVKQWLVHGDFYVRHLLIDEERQLAGVIDWGDLHVGDPAIDLAIAHSFLPVGAHNQFKQTYGEISDETWGLAKLRAIHSSSVILLFGHHSGDAALVDEGSRSLRLIASPSPI